VEWHRREGGAQTGGGARTHACGSSGGVGHADVHASGARGGEGCDAGREFRPPGYFARLQAPPVRNRKPRSGAKAAGVRKETQRRGCAPAAPRQRPGRPKRRHCFAAERRAGGELLPASTAAAPAISSRQCVPRVGASSKAKGAGATGKDQRCGNTPPSLHSGLREGSLSRRTVDRAAEPMLQEAAARLLAHNRNGHLLRAPHVWH
jgi:hypothetical protein